MRYLFFLFFPLINSLASEISQDLPGKKTSTQTSSRLSNPLIGDDGRIYFCSDRNFFAFENNGSMAWTLRLDFTCNGTITPVLAGRGKMYVIAENRILDINYFDSGSPSPTSQVFFGPEKGQKDAGELIGLAVSTLSSSLYINIKNRGLFAFTASGKLLWSVGPVLSKFGYSLGCRKGIQDCYFSSVPVIDLCEASLYISNTVGELYSLSLASPHFNWVEDLSSFDKDFGVTAGNNGLLYVTVSSKAVIVALHVSMGSVVWQTRVGPLSAVKCNPVVNSNGWMSIGSLDGFLYSISPTGEVMKFAKASQVNNVIQVSPFGDCSGYAIYISQAQMEGKVDLVISEYNYVSAMRPKGVVFTLLVPETGAIYWSESYPGQFLSSLSKSDLQRFVLDESVLLAFIAASGTGNPLPCRSQYEKLVSSCSQARPKHLRIYAGNEKTVILFLLFESIVLLVLGGLVRFCCTFWGKKKLQHLELGKFLEKRVLLRTYIKSMLTHLEQFQRSLQQKKKAVNRTISEVAKKAAEGNEVMEEIGDLVRERQGVERKLSTSYSLGRDQIGRKSKSLLPVYDEKSLSFRSGKEEHLAIFQASESTCSSCSGEEDSSGSSGENESRKMAVSVLEDEKQVASSSEAATRNTWLKRTFSSTY